MSYHKYKWNSELIIGFTIITLLLIIACVSLFYTPYDPDAMDIVNKLQAPSLLHLLGTDQFGRDILSRMMVGTQMVFIIGFATVIISLLVGGALGILAGYYGGWVDTCIMKFIEAKMAFPGTLLALMLISIFTPTLGVLITALSIMNIPRFTRVIRSGYLQYKHAEFIDAARALGLTDMRIILVHILPNVSSNILVTATLSFSTAILAEAGLSYLGLGLQPPLSSWGIMLGEAQTYMLQSPLLAIIPGVMLTLVVIAFNLISDGLGKQL